MCSCARLAMVGEDEHTVRVGHVVDIEVKGRGLLLIVDLVDEVVFGFGEEAVEALDDMLVEIVAAILAECLIDMDNT